VPVTQELQTNLASGIGGARTDELGASIQTGLDQVVTGLRQLLPDSPDGDSLDGVLLAASQAYANFKSSGALGHAACGWVSTPCGGRPCGVCMPNCRACADLVSTKSSCSGEQRTVDPHWLSAGVGGYDAQTVLLVAAAIAAAVAASVPRKGYGDTTDALPPVYDVATVATFYRTRPVEVAQRTAAVLLAAARFGASLLLDQVGATVHGARTCR